jgi:hypothetical protein
MLFGETSSSSSLILVSEIKIGRSALLTNVGELQERHVPEQTYSFEPSLWGPSGGSGPSDAARIPWCGKYLPRFRSPLGSRDKFQKAPSD